MNLVSWCPGVHPYGRRRGGIGSQRGDCPQLLLKMNFLLHGFGVQESILTVEGGACPLYLLYLLGIHTESNNISLPHVESSCGYSSNLSDLFDSYAEYSYI